MKTATRVSPSLDCPALFPAHPPDCAGQRKNKNSPSGTFRLLLLLRESGVCHLVHYRCVCTRFTPFSMAASLRFIYSGRKRIHPRSPSPCTLHRYFPYLYRECRRNNTEQNRFVRRVSNNTSRNVRNKPKTKVYKTSHRLWWKQATGGNV